MDLFNVERDFVDRLGTKPRKATENECRRYFLTVTIYHQTYDGSINYHESEKKLAPLFEKAAIQCQKEILNNVQSQLEQLVEEARKKAESLAREILKMEGEA